MKGEKLLEGRYQIDELSGLGTEKEGRRRTAGGEGDMDGMGGLGILFVFPSFNCCRQQVGNKRIGSFLYKTCDCDCHPIYLFHPLLFFLMYHQFNEI